MDDLISRQAAIDAICKNGTNLERDKCYVISIATAKQRAVDIICDLPSAQANLQPTCNQLATDCISRQAAIKAIEDLQDCYNGFSDTYDKACIIGVLEELPSAQPERTADCWIPVSDGLPENGEEVWVTIKGYDVITVEDGETIEQAIERINKIRWVTRAYWSEEENGWNDPTFGCPLVVRPIAWMPMQLPEPYKEEQE